MGTPFANDWDIWIFPPKSDSEPAAVKICQSTSDAVEHLRAGRKVLLDAHQLGSHDNANLARFKPVYWSAAFFEGQFTLGALVRNDHPALARFPTDDHYDWQWEALCRNARAFQLKGMPLEYQPIVQPIGDFHYGWKLGTIFELRVGKGQLLVCGYDVSGNLAERPTARQLRTSLLEYMNSSHFAPTTEITEAQMAEMFPIVEKASVAKPKN